MNNKFTFSTYGKIRFIFFYLFNLLRLPFEVNVGKWEIIYAEILWLSIVLRKKSFKLDNIVERDYFETKFGKYYIQNNLEGLIVVSPSFERLDIEKISSLIKKEIAKKQKVLFIDVGAYFGDFTIKVSKKLRNPKNLTILALEPETTRYKLLLKNLKLNKIKNVQTKKIGLSNKNGKNDLDINVKTLDSLLSEKYLNKFDHVFVKLDIDGYELPALLGAKRFIKKTKAITLLIEDFVDRKIVKEVQKDFVFLDKLSTYNSFWSKKND